MQLTPEQVNEFVANAILKSTIGEQVQKAVDTVIKELSKSYQNPYEAVIKQHINRAIEECVLTNYKDTIADEVKKVLEIKLQRDVIKSIVHKIFDSSRYT
jgi:hypothetical protein